MIHKQALAFLGLGLCLAGAGCVSCGHEACRKVIEAGPNCPEPMSDRRHVYAVLVNGLTPSGSLEELRLKLAEGGFEKVYRGELCHSWWMWREMKRVHRCDPAARFVLVGYGLGSTVAAGLAEDAAREGLPVDTVVFIDPAGLKDPRACAERTVIIRAVEGVEGMESGSINIRGCGHFALPTHTQTIETIAAVLGDAATRVLHSPEGEDSYFLPEWAPPPRDYRLPPGISEEWNFLYDRPDSIQDTVSWHTAQITTAGPRIMVNPPQPDLVSMTKDPR